MDYDYLIGKIVEYNQLTDNFKIKEDCVVETKLYDDKNKKSAKESQEKT